MISKLKLHNFKCFEDEEIPFNMMTLLAGENGSGKSTIIQAILIFAQSNVQSRIARLNLLGEYVKIGYSHDILYEFNEEKEPHIKMALFLNNKEYTIDAKYKSQETTLELLNDIEVAREGVFNNRFEYIAAERISPEKVFSIFESGDKIGVHGENVMNYLIKYGSKPVFDEICVKEIENTLAMQVDYWIGQLFGGFSVRIEELIKSDTISLRYQEVSREDKSNERRPINVGYGITYILPVIVALLKANPGDVVVIENPECHLHPRAQRIMGEIIAYISSRGIQVIVETHSDHVLNGLRLSVKRSVIRKEDTQILMLEREDVGQHYHTNIYSPNIMDNGDLDVWPEGFFDEWDNALIQLLEK